MKLRKKLIALSALTLSLIMVVPVFADNPVGWQKNETGWWYGTNATGTTWYHDGWQWIDGNKDGISECYYFAPNGYIVTNGKTPDGYDVNADHKWCRTDHRCCGSTGCRSIDHHRRKFWITCIVEEQIHSISEKSTLQGRSGTMVSPTFT